ncbi:MAG: ABC transporter ATP-binding protein [Deltaproteobacteria bacterium]|nr:ABC transporter ATP-binding protein [Deltaproteobacteria bacterium]
MLEVKDLRVLYGKAEALKGISLEIEDGSIVTLIGSNGSGKTTTLRAISGLKKAASGEIHFKGERIKDKKPHEIVKLGISHIPEGRMVFAPMSVLDNLLLGAHLRRNKQEITRDLDNTYAHFPVLKTKASQPAGSLSGGEQQMLATARALMARPRLLLMDEPSMGLAPLLVAQVGKIIEDINRQGVSILLVEQNARMALNLAAKAYVLLVGRIVLEGEVKALASNEEIKKAYLGFGD